MNAVWNVVLRPKALAVGAILLSLVGVFAFAMSRQAGPAAPTVVAPERPAQPPRPALTAAEEQYIRALWPIHGDVERSVMSVSLGQIFYKTQELRRNELGTRVEQALATFNAAETRIAGLEPPPSLRSNHDDYLAAVRLFKESTVEVRKMFADGKDDHMAAAYPKSLEGSNKIREIGGKFWPQEFPPN